MIDYTITRSRRKTIAIYITKDAAVEVRAPLGIRKDEIHCFLMSKQEWIKKHLHSRRESLKNKSDFSLSYGDIVCMQGAEYPINPSSGNSIGFDGKCFYLPPGLPSEEIRRGVIEIYIEAAKKVLTHKTVKYSKIMSVTPRAIKVNGAKTRWGSCSGKDSINFSWRLIMADDGVIDYVVVHELAHIIEHNHSPRFWAVVTSILPDYKIRQKRLKELQQRLSAEDWD